MALIRCPECGKDVSDKAPVCIHCGYPLQQPAFSGLDISKKVVIPSYKETTPTKIPCIKIVREITGMGLAEAKEFVEQPIPYIVVKDGLSDNQANLIVQKFQSARISAQVQGSSEPVSFVNPQKEKDIIVSKVEKHQIKRHQKKGKMVGFCKVVV